MAARPATLLPSLLFRSLRPRPGASAGTVGRATLQSALAGPTSGEKRAIWDPASEHAYLPLHLVAAIAALAFAVLVFRLPFRAFVDSLNIDDSFYYLQIARNSAHGLFSTFDGIERTNGYHPLWAAILTPVFVLVRDPALAVRTAKMVELVMLAWASLLLMASGRRAGWSPLLAIVAPVCLFGCPVLYSGMETSLQVLLYAALLHELMRAFRDGPRRAPQVNIALIACLLPWARLEALSASVFALVAITLEAVGRRRALRPVAISWMSLAISISFYFSYNLLVFGSAAPVSGAVKTYWSSLRFADAGGETLFRSLYAYYMSYKVQLGEAGLIATMGLCSWSLRSYRSAAFSMNHALDAFIAILVLSFLSRILYAVVFVDIMYDNRYYYVPYFLIHAVTIPYVFSRASLLVALSQPGVWRSLRGPSVVACGVVLVGVTWHVHPWSLPATWRRAPPTTTWSQASLDGAEWMNRNLPRGAVIGSPDAGVVGFFTDRRVVNLDGLVNSQEFFLAMKTQSVERWMRSSGITHLANAVRTPAGGGCAFIAAASAQRVPFGSPCIPVYKGLTFRQSWLGRSDRMQFQVYKFDRLQDERADDRGTALGRSGKL